MSRPMEQKISGLSRPPDKSTNQPDGGWGWVICLAFAIANMLSMSTVSSFTLLFKDKFKEVGLSATDTSLIINTNSVMGMAMGIFVGPMLKLLGYRKVAFIGGVFFSMGVIFTAWANSLTFFMATYSFACAIGLGLCSSAFPLAINTYFSTKRTRAFGVAVTIAGLGPILFPQLVSLLLYEYGVTWACLILGAVNLNIFVAATLLQPVKYHMRKRRKSMLLNECEAATGYCSESETSVKPSQPKKARDNESNNNQKEIHYSTTELHDSTQIVLHEEVKKPKHDSKVTQKIVKLFDLDILKDVRFLNLLLGISIAVYSEINFSLLTPLILTDLGYTTNGIAGFMSTLGTADILFRFCAPFVGERLGQTAQSMCTFSFIAAIIGRTLVIFCSNFQQLLIVAIGLGIAKGFRSVYLNLVIPNYLPLELLPSASGIQMVTKGLILLIFGPLLGIIRDYTGSYTSCIVFINVVTLITVIMWSVEMIYLKQQKSSEESRTIETH